MFTGGARRRYRYALVRTYVVCAQAHMEYLRALSKHVPKVSRGHRTRRTPVCFGASSNYGADRGLGAGEFQALFRFFPRDIPRLMDALRIPAYVNRLRLPGDEALLILLSRLAYPSRLVELSLVFGRSTGTLSTIIGYMVDHLMVIASEKVVKFDPKYWTPYVQYFARAIHRAGAPLENIWCFIDGTFRPCARPGQDGSTGLQQRGYYSGYKHRYDEV